MPPQAMTSPGSGARSESATAASGLGQSFAATHFQGGRGRQGAQFMRQAGGLRQADRLRLQAGQGLAEDQGRGGVRHGAGFSARRRERSNKDDAG